MKTIFVEARSDIDINLPKSAYAKLPKNIALLTTVQHIHKINDVKRQLENNKKKIFLLKGKHSKYKSQILGCDVLHLKQNKDIQAFLYIGTGTFHPKELLLTQKKPVFVFNPISKKFYKMDRREVDSIENRQRGAYMRFLNSTNIGVILSIKPGQYNLNQALKLKQKYKEKNFFYLLFDTVDLNELENFPFIECFVNTACPRIAYDDAIKTRKPILNIEDVL